MYMSWLNVFNLRLMRMFNPNPWLRPLPVMSSSDQVSACFASWVSASHTVHARGSHDQVYHHVRYSEWHPSSLSLLHHFPWDVNHKMSVCLSHSSVSSLFLFITFLFSLSTMVNFPFPFIYTHNHISCTMYTRLKKKKTQNTFYLLQWMECFIIKP